MKNYNKEDIIEDFQSLQSQFSKQLSRADYRKFGEYSTSLIERIFGTWTEFVRIANVNLALSRHEIIKKTNSRNVIITSIIDGCEINWNAFNILRNIATFNNADLFILWSKSLSKGKILSEEDYNKISPYLCTELQFKDKTIIAQDLLISNSCKKPLSNLEKISNNYNIFIVAHSKQYHQMAPNDCNSETRQLWSTGTISEVNYEKSVSGQLNSNYHTFGGLFLEYDLYTNKYLVRNLEYKDNCIEDIDKKYTINDNNISIIDVHTSIPAMVLGDLHLPEQDSHVFDETIKLIEKVNPKCVFLHDIFSLNSINHHDLNNPLSRIIKQDDFSKSLEVELLISLGLLEESLLKRFPDIMFYVVASNHDNFMMKWLNSGKYIYDTPNSIIGHEMWAKIARGKHPYADMIKCKNIIFLDEHDSLQPVIGIECAIHGHQGIAGAKGSANSFVKTFNKSVTGHTHSSKIFESNVTVGTNSMYNLNYTGKIMNWSHANALIFQNSAIQLVFMD